MKHLTEKLKKVGLSDHESLVYSELLQNSPSGATFLAKKCNLSRSSVYTILNALSIKGLVGTTYKNEVKQFVSDGEVSLERFLKKEKADLDEKFETLKSIGESLRFFNNPTLNVPQIIFFEGQEGLKKIYLSMMREAPKDSVLYLLRDEFVWEEEWKFIFQDEWKGRISRIKKEKNITMQLLVNYSDLEKEKQKIYKSKKGLQYRFLSPDNSVKNFAMYILGDTLSILSIEKNNLVGIKIVNQHLAKNFQSVFSSLWQSSKKR